MALIGFRCPNCGGEIDVREGVKNIVCSYCGSGFVLSRLTGAPRYYARPQKIEKLWIRSLCGDEILDMDLIFVPVVEVESEIFGFVWGYRIEKRELSGVRGVYEEPPLFLPAFETLKKRVNFLRRERIFPTGNFPPGLERIDLEGVRFLEYDDEEVHRYGKVMDIPFPPEYYRKEGIEKMKRKILRLYRDYTSIKYHLVPVLPRISIFYYPLVFVRYKKGILTIDAVKKKVLLRVERKEKKREFSMVPLFLGVLALISAMSRVAGLIMLGVFFLLLKPWR